MNAKSICPKEMFCSGSSSSRRKSGLSCRVLQFSHQDLYGMSFVCPQFRLGGSSWHEQWCDSSCPFADFSVLCAKRTRQIASRTSGLHSRRQDFRVPAARPVSVEFDLEWNLTSVHIGCITFDDSRAVVWMSLHPCLNSKCVLESRGLCDAFFVWTFICHWLCACVLLSHHVYIHGIIILWFVYPEACLAVRHWFIACLVFTKSR